ncbi:hypothetical protein HAX54_042848, partial [Datura stramonium]|nr:hypothetical protein [Datura stramonium]
NKDPRESQRQGIASHRVNVSRGRVWQKNCASVCETEEGFSGGGLPWITPPMLLH